MTIEEFKKKVKELDIELTEEMLEKLEKYMNFLIEYNKHTNLTRIIEKQEIYLKHFYDSLTITKVIDLKKESSLLDFGTGAGFPGMVLKIVFPNLKVTLLDSNNKKVRFLEELKKIIDVNNIEIICDRVENYAKNHLNYFDIVTARAVTNMPVLTELAMPLVKVGKYFIAMKGSNQEEIENSKYAIEKLNGKIDKIETFLLSKESGYRNIIKVTKKLPTKLEEMRSYEKIVKKPLQKSNK